MLMQGWQMWIRRARTDNLRAGVRVGASERAPQASSERTAAAGRRARAVRGASGASGRRPNAAGRSHARAPSLPQDKRIESLGWLSLAQSGPSTPRTNVHRSAGHQGSCRSPNRVHLAFDGSVKPRPTITEFASVAFRRGSELHDTIWTSSDPDGKYGNSLCHPLPEALPSTSPRRPGSH